MTERSICPACSAPLDYSAGDQQVRCVFCGAEYLVIREGAGTRLQVVGQPQPQKDELSRAGQEVAKEAGKEAADEIAAILSESTPEPGVDTEPPAFTSEPTVIHAAPPATSEPTVIRSSVGQEADFFEQTGASPEPSELPAADELPAAEELPAADEMPAAFNQPTAFEQAVTTEQSAADELPAADLPPTYESPPPGSAPAGQGVVYERAAPPRSTPSGGRNQWLIWTIAILVILCLLCLCVGGAIVVFLSPTGINTGF